MLELHSECIEFFQEELDDKKSEELIRGIIQVFENPEVHYLVVSIKGEGDCGQIETICVEDKNFQPVSEVSVPGCIGNLLFELTCKDNPGFEINDGGGSQTVIQRNSENAELLDFCYSSHIVQSINQTYLGSI